MSAIGKVSGATGALSPNSSGAKIAALQRKIQQVTQEIKELTENEGMDPSVKQEMLKMKSAMIQGYQAQMMAIMSQEAQQATGRAQDVAQETASKKIDSLGARAQVDVLKNEQRVEPDNSVIVHIDSKKLDDIRHQKQEENTPMMPESPSEQRQAASSANGYGHISEYV